MRIILLAWFAAVGISTALEVHEWGTFTVLSGADGVPVSWYQPGKDLAALPDFVAKAGSSKMGNARVRMEPPSSISTPGKPQHVTVSATLKGGDISEMFPFSKSPIALAHMPMHRSGTLLLAKDGSSPAHLAEIDSLELGRFASGAAKIAANLTHQEMMMRFQNLEIGRRDSGATSAR